MMKKSASFIMAIVLLCITVIPTNAISQELIIDDDFTTVYTSDVIFGKRFDDGNNVPVTDKKQFDITINNVKIKTNNNIFQLAFQFDKSLISINFIPLSAEANNYYKDHYIFSPIGFEHNTYEIVNIQFTVNANDYDLMTANYDMIGKNVLSIILKNTHNNDIYYLQGIIDASFSSKMSLNTIETIVNTINVKDTAMSEILRQNANEFYYITSSPELMITQEECESDSSVTLEKNELLSIKSSDHNYFYNIGVPDSIFQTETNEWGGQRLSTTPYRYCVYYPFQKFGSQNINTHIMIYNYDYSVVDSGYVSSHNMYRSTAELTIRVEYNETIVYRPYEDSYELSLGGNDLVEFHPSIEWKKSGGDIGLIVSAREFSGDGRSLSGGSANGISQIIVGVFDNVVTNGWISVTMDVLSLLNVGTEPYSFGSNRKTYYQTALEQETIYGYAIGGMKLKMNGYLLSPEDEYRVLVEFNAPTQAMARKVTWVTYYSLDVHG